MPFRRGAGYDLDARTNVYTANHVWVGQVIDVPSVDTLLMFRPTELRVEFAVTENRPRRSLVTWILAAQGVTLATIGVLATVLTLMAAGRRARLMHHHGWDEPSATAHLAERWPHLRHHNTDFTEYLRAVTPPVRVRRSDRFRRVSRRRRVWPGRTPGPG